jgi:4-diphosphocytidyl-2-C-methyl-D-erythritol kinase
VLRAFAKVNYALEVRGLRDDGYHEISSVYQSVSLADELEIERSRGGFELIFEPDGVEVGPLEENTVYKAWALLWEVSGHELPARITLHKKIPAGAGLGGGSADAAAVLVGLNRLWGLRWPVARLAEVAVTLGMDVPFFLQGGAALATGRGEVLEPVSGGGLALVLVNPRVGLSTAEAYRRVTPDMLSDGRRVKAMVEALRGRRAARVANTLYNGLELAVAPIQPEIERMRAALLAAGALGAVMSGSGPTVVGVARSFEHARQLRARLARASWTCWAVRATRAPAVRLQRPAR